MKIYNVKTQYIGSTSYIAQCEDCNWNYEKYNDHREGQRKIRKHVAETGHTISLEKNVVIHYIAKHMDPDKS